MIALTKRLNLRNILNPSKKISTKVLFNNNNIFNQPKQDTK